MLNYEKSIENWEKGVKENFGDMDLNTTSLPVGTLLSARAHYTTLLAYYYEKEADDDGNYHDAKLVRENEIDAAFIRLKEGRADKLALSEAKIECKEVLRSEQILYREWKSTRAKVKSLEAIINTLNQVISAAKKEGVLPDNQRIGE